MLNIVYNKFTEYFIKGYNNINNYEPINLEETDTYKIALLNSGYVPNSNDIWSFSDLQNTGYEVTDSNDSYETGGDYITFTDLGKNNESDTTLKYSAGTVRWTDTCISDACSAIIYRESDGLLISCHTFDRAYNTDGDDIVIDWKDIPTLIIKNMSEDDIYTMDYSLNIISNNAVANRTITNIFKDLGVVFTDDLGDESSPYPKEIPAILPEDEYEKATGEFDPEGTYYKLENNTYVLVSEPIEEEFDNYYVFLKSYSDDWANSLTYVTTLKNQDVDNIFNEILEEE